MTKNADNMTAAREALHALDTRLSDHRVLNVQCQRSHHVAAVYETPAGLVYQADTGPHAHGSKDFVDTPHGAATRGNEYADMLAPNPLTGDEIPAWCDCGPWTLSRSQLQQQAQAREGTVHLP